MNAGYAALNVAEATMIGVVATTFACSDHNNVMAYYRGPYINVGALFYALIASLLSNSNNFASFPIYLPRKGAAQPRYFASERAEGGRYRDAAAP